MLVNNLIAIFSVFNCSFVESAELVGFFEAFEQISWRTAS